MKQMVKWMAIMVGGLTIITVAVLLIAPMLLKVQHFKPLIENKVAQATGRSFQVSHVELSLFPWAGLRLSGAKLGNPKGFSGSEFATVGAFELKVQLLPLLFKEIQLDHISLKGLRILLEKRKDGQGNWTFEAAAPADGKMALKGKPAPGGTSEGLNLNALAVGQIDITDCQVKWIDHTRHVHKDIAGISMRVKDISLDRPLVIQASALLDKTPVSLSGSIGPLGNSPGKGDIPLNLRLTAFKQLSLAVTGIVHDPAANMKYDARIEVNDFSPKDVVQELGVPFPVLTSDGKALQKVSLQARVSGSGSQAAITDGVARVDDSTMKFDVQLADVSLPDIVFSFHLDRVDLDRYLPPAREEKSASQKAAPVKTRPPAEKDDALLRKIRLEGELRVDQFKAYGLSSHDVLAKVSGQNSLFTLKLLSMGLYGGALSAGGSWDFRRNISESRIELAADKIQAGPMLKALLGKDILTGMAKMEASLIMNGETSSDIKKTLNGAGRFSVLDGVIKGVDLRAMVQNIKSAFSEKADEKVNPETAFTALQIPFTAKNGVIYTEKATLASPVLQVEASGKADLPKEKLDYRVVSTLTGVATKEAGVSIKIGRLTVPVLVSGSFSRPVFSPDLSGALGKGVEKMLPGVFEKQIKPPTGSGDASKADSLKESLKGVFKGISGDGK